MPKVIHNALTPVAAKALAERGEPGRHADGAGLYLHVTGKGQAKWALRYMLDRKPREMGLGTAYRRADGDKTVAAVSLADARQAAKAVRVKIDAGIDPLAEREAEEARRRAAEREAAEAALLISPDRTFKAAFDAWLEAHGPAMRTERQRVLAKGLMARHVFPLIGAKPVAKISTADMADVLRPIWRTKAETALRARIRCEAVFAWARANGWREAPNPAVWKENLAPLLGRQGEAARVTHHKAMHWRDVPSFMRRLEAQNGPAALAMRWLILTAARTGEVLGATWAEIDMEAPGGPVWVIPAPRMKMGVEHRVPLTGDALAVLDAARPLRSDAADATAFLFPGGAGTRGGRIAGGRPGAERGGLSQMALLTLLRRMGVAKETTAHGFRSAFRQWAAECTATPEAVAEAALAHAVGNEVQRAYQRSDLLERRRLLMAQWGQHCSTVPADVVALLARRA
jgi:integrase